LHVLTCKEEKQDKKVLEVPVERIPVKVGMEEVVVESFG